MLIFCQIHFNPTGYNFVVYWIGLVLIAYFDEVKTVSVGGFKLDKYEKVAKHIEESIVGLLRTNLQLTMHQRKSFFAWEGILHENYEDLMKIISIIAELPIELQIKLDSDVRRQALYMSQIQERYINEKGEGATSSDKEHAQNALTQLKKLADLGIQGLTL